MGAGGGGGEKASRNSGAAAAGQAFPLARRSLRHLSFSLAEDLLLLCRLPETLPDQAAYLTYNHQQFAPFIEHLL